MKNEYKFMRLLLVGIIVCTGGYLPGTEVLATNIEQSEEQSISISAEIVTKKLKKEEYFTAFIKVETDKSIDELRKVIRYIDLQGGTSASVDKQKVQIMDNGNEGKTIIIPDLIYNGKSKIVEVEIEYTTADGKTEVVKTGVVLENAEADLKASEGFTLSSNMINVVAGQNQQITLTVKNDTKSYVEAGSMELKIKDPKSAKGITLKKKKIDLTTMSPDSQKDYYLTIDIDEKVTRGIHDMEVTIGGTVHTVKLKVDSNFMPPSLEVAVENGTGCEANVAKVVHVTVKNVGHVEAKKVK